MHDGDDDDGEDDDGAKRLLIQELPEAASMCMQRSLKIYLQALCGAWGDVAKLSGP